MNQLVLLAVTTSFVALRSVPTMAASPAPPLVLERTITLPGVGGRIDHLAVDLQHRRLFVAELGNGTVEAVDLDTGKVAHRIGGLKEPQGLAYLPARNELVVASGGDGMVRFYDADTFVLTGSIHVGDDADNVHVEPRSGHVVVGYGTGALAVIDPATRRIVGALPLPAHPEGFRIDESGGRVIVNVPDAQQIVVGDLASGRVVTSWKAAHRWNFPMALDPASGAAAVVYRLPSRLAVLDAGTGQVRQDLPACGDADDVFFDAKRHRLYVSCGTGKVDVLQAGPGGYRAVASAGTRLGARTSLFVPELDRLFVAARAGLVGLEAAILVFRLQP